MMHSFQSCKGRIMTMGGEKDPAMLILSSTASAVMMSAAIGLNIFNVVSTKKYLQKQSNVGADVDLDIERVERENDNFDN